jgi:hypothetical protein
MKWVVLALFPASHCQISLYPLSAVAPSLYPQLQVMEEVPCFSSPDCQIQCSVPQLVELVSKQTSSNIKEIIYSGRYEDNMK